MKLLPYNQMFLESSLTPEEITAHLGSKIEERKWVRFIRGWTTLSGGGNRFEGVITSNQFTISRIIGYGNSFKPIISGRVDPLDNSSLISLTMRPHTAVELFMVLWFSGVLTGMGAAVFAVFSGKTNSIPALLISFVMLIFAAAMVNGGFWYEVMIQKPMLLELFKAKEISDLSLTETNAR
jgi:hypothetical protein